MIKNEEEFFQFVISFFSPFNDPTSFVVSSETERQNGGFEDAIRPRDRSWPVVTWSCKFVRDCQWKWVAVARRRCEERERKEKKKEERTALTTFLPLPSPLSLSLSRKASRTVYKQFTCPGRLKKTARSYGFKAATSFDFLVFLYDP